MMNKQKAIELSGGRVTDLAQILGISVGAVSQWGDEIPEARYWQLRAIRPEWFKGGQQKDKKVG